MISFRSIRTMIATFIALVVGTVTASAQSPDVYVEDWAESLVSAPPQLYWKAGCGDDFSPQRSHVRTVPAAIPGGAVPRPLIGRDIFNPLLCGPDRVASRNIAVDDSHVYWITGDRRLVRIRRDAAGGLPESVLSVRPANDAGYSLAVSDGWIAWTDGSGVFRAQIALLGDGRPSTDTILEPGGPDRVRELVPAASGYVLLLGSRLARLTPSLGDPRRFMLFRLAASQGVTAFAVLGNQIYLALPRREGAYSIGTLGTGATYQTLHVAPDALPDDRVDQIAVAGDALYWHVVRRGGGPIMRWPLAGGAAARVTADIRLPADSRLIATPGYLFWASDRAIMRLARNSPPVAPPAGDIWITGVEWVQVVQTPDNQVPMVAGKPTAIRVYARSREDSNGPWTNVGALLQVAGSPLAHNLGPITLSPAGSDRRRLEGSFLFSLRPEETRPGTRRIQITLSAGDFRREADLANNTRTFDVTFAPRIDLRLLVLTPVWQNTAVRCLEGVHPSAPDNVMTQWPEVLRQQRLLQAIMPASSIALGRSAENGRAFDNADCGAHERAFNYLGDEVGRLTGKLIGVVIGPPSADRHGHGSCCIPDHGDRRAMIINNGFGPSYTLAHEVGHFFGMIHPFDPGSGYPRSPSDVAPIGDVVGVDFSGNVPGLVLGQGPGGPLRSDFMSYHPNLPHWISIYTYCRILRGMSEGRTFCPAGVEGGGP